MEALERLEAWLTGAKVPVGRLAEDAVAWLTANAAPVFTAIEEALEALIAAILAVLQFPPPVIAIVALTVLVYAIHRSWKLSLGTLSGLLLILNLGFFEETTETLTLVLSATFVCMAVGVPMGIFLAHHPRAYRVARPLLDLMQTLPTFVYLIPAIVFFGIGMVPGLVATVIFVLPAPIRLTQLGISSTPKALKEAALAFGATKGQLLRKVELPYALPQIGAGLTQTVMLSLSMVVVAALVGADGLGVPVVRALNSVDIGKGFEAGLAIVVVAILLDRLLRLTGRRA